MNKNILPDLGDALRLSENEFIDKYVGDVFDVDAEAIVYEKLYRFANKYDDYLVKYSYWFNPNDSKALPGGQIDFIVCKKEIGFALLEVKAGSFTQVKLDKAFNQTMKANYSLNKDINVYNIVIFPEDELDDAKKNQYMNNNDEKEKIYILDEKDFNKWDNPDEIKQFFDNFFNDEKRYKEKNKNTDKIIEREFDIEKYSKEIEKERIAKEQKLIDDKTKIVNIVKNNDYNCFFIRGKAGTGKTFIAMNIAKDSDKNTLFICRNGKLFNVIEKYFKKELEIYSPTEFVNYESKSKYNNPKKVVFKLKNNKSLTLYKLELKQYEEYNIGKFKKLVNDNDLIIIDEIQDSGYYEFDVLLKKVLKDKNKVLYLIGDENQFTYDFENKDFNLKFENFKHIKDDIICYKKNKELLYLDIDNDNCRNNLEIRDFIYRLLDDKYIISAKIINNINVIFCNKSNDNIQELLIDIKDISKMQIIYLNKLDIFDGIKYIKYPYIYNLIKGCEYNRVLVLGCTKKHIVFKHNEIENTIKRQQLSLSAGRAKEDLILVFYIENENEKKEVKEILIKDYKFDKDCFI